MTITIVEAAKDVTDWASIIIPTVAGLAGAGLGGFATWWAAKWQHDANEKKLNNYAVFAAGRKADLVRQQMSRLQKKLDSAENLTINTGVSWIEWVKAPDDSYERLRFSIEEQHRLRTACGDLILEQAMALARGHNGVLDSIAAMVSLRETSVAKVKAERRKRSGVIMEGEEVESFSAGVLKMLELQFVQMKTSAQEISRLATQFSNGLPMESK